MATDEIVDWIDLHTPACSRHAAAIAPRETSPLSLPLLRESQQKNKKKLLTYLAHLPQKPDPFNP